jgi:hypothetical protein
LSGSAQARTGWSLGKYDRETNRDLLPNAIPLAAAYVASITNVRSDHLGWHRARLTFMARFVCSVLTLRTTDLWRIGTSLKAGVQPAFNHRRIQRRRAGSGLGPAATYSHYASIPTDGVL